MSEEGIMGRNTWIAWNAGNQRMWDFAAQNSIGIVDLLKVVDSMNRPVRFKEMGLINEPEMVSMTAAEGEVKANPFGVRLDVPRDPEKRAELYDETYGLYKTEGLDPKVYGYSSGVMGIRLFPNPAFFEGEGSSEAKSHWGDGKKYYDDLNFYRSMKLVRSYRPGMTCGICHVAFNPIYPPDNPEEPEFVNLSSAIGNQYFREGLALGRNLTLKPDHESDFYWQVVNVQPAGTSDTSRIASDHINGPTAINAIFRLGERLRVAKDSNPKEEMGDGAMLLPPDFPEDAGNRMRSVPHILRDGADSVGAPGATIRVYVNIGLFSEYWLKRQMPR